MYMPDLKIRLKDNVLIQIGAGAGDLDPRSNMYDGFCDMVKNNIPAEIIAKIILVEPNPFNIPKLKECWEIYDQAQIVQAAVTDEPSHKATLYYCEKDEPHYQTASLSLDHVKSIYPNDEIREIAVDCININDFFIEYAPDGADFLAIDAEGLDARLIEAIDWVRYPISVVNIEHLHLRDRTYPVIDLMRSHGYHLYSKGLDPMGLDWIFYK